jgi:signal transduction histidine kinase
MAQRQAMLYGLLRSVGEQLDPQSVARAAVDAIVQLVDTQARWPAVSIALLERDRQTWMNYAARGHLSPTVGLRYRLNQGIIGRTFRTGRPQHVPEVLNDPDYVEGNASTRSELAVPVRHGESVLGVLNLESDQPNGYTPDDMLLAESLADAVALALDNANLYQTVSDERSRLQALIESSRDGILMVSRDYRLLVVNAPVLQLLHLPGQPDDWVGRPVTGLFLALRRQAPRVARAFVREVRRLERGDEPSAEGEAEVPPRVLYWLSLPVLAGAAPLGRLLVLRDVSEARLLQKLRDELTDTLVHDLRNPLTNIRMALELVEQVSAGVANEQQQSAMQIARLSTDRMLALVNAILDVSRLEAGQMPVKREALALPGLVADVFVQQQPLAQEKQLHLCNAVPPSLPAVPADPNLMRRVLENLVGNAVKFVPDGGQIQVSAVAEDGQVVVTVRDDGPGLSPEMRANAFQRFVTGRHHAHGTGLGLAFCRLAVEAHGGRIWVDSELGRGAAFCFTLPLGENGR